MKTTFLHWRTKLFFTAVICSLFSNAFGDHGGGSHINVNLSVPGTSSTGNYTVTWTNNADQSLGEIEDLQEKTTGAYANVYTGYNGSVSFYSKPSATYSYRVRYKMCFFSSCSYSYSLPEPIVVSSGSPPGVPGNLTVPVTAADNGSGASYDVTWSDSSGSADYYALDRKTSTTNWTNIQYNSSLSKSESGMSADTYMYRVRGCNAQGCSANSAIETTVVMLDNITSAPSVQTAGAVGTAPYALRADTDGDTVISVPLSLIPGVAGFAPTLSLEYDSGRGVERLERSLPEDSIGYGWKLGGLSQIRRCVVNQASGNSIQLNNNDSLCLDGMPLVTASGTHFATGTVYRTLIESFARIEIKDDSGDRWFEVKFPDGTVREYGRTFDSRVNQNGGTDFQWSLNKETSADGNVIYYTYYVDIANGINYITNINYTGANVDFEYRTRTDAASVSIGTSTQTQTVFLHTIRVRYTGFKVREYRLLDEVVSGHRRLNELQLCGFNEIGSTMTCLEPTNFGWMTPTSTMAGVDILVDGISDGLGAVHQIEYGTITGSSHPFLFTERPFGNGTPPSDTQLLSGSGALRHVTTKIRRDNGLGGFHDTTYAYQNRGLESTKHWGFLGFYAQRVTDVPSGLVTYVQIRVDYPYFGKAARFLRLDANYGSHSATLIRVENDYAQQSIVHSAGITEYPYAAETEMPPFFGHLVC